MLEHLRDAVRSRQWDLALDVLEEFEARGIDIPVRAYTQMIAAASRQNMLGLMQTLFDDLRQRGIRPTPTIYSCVLEAYARSNNVFAVLDILGEIRQTHAVATENMRFYGNIVFAYFMIGRADEAFALIDDFRSSDMPMDLFLDAMYTAMRSRSFQQFVRRREVLAQILESLVKSDRTTDAELQAFVSFCGNEFEALLLLVVLNQERVVFALSPEQQDFALGRLARALALRVELPEQVRGRALHTVQVLFNWLEARGHCFSYNTLVSLMVGALAPRVADVPLALRAALWLEVSGRYLRRFGPFYELLQAVGTSSVSEEALRPPHVRDPAAIPGAQAAAAAVWQTAGNQDPDSVARKAQRAAAAAAGRLGEEDYVAADGAESAQKEMVGPGNEEEQEEVEEFHAHDAGGIEGDSLEYEEASDVWQQESRWLYRESLRPLQTVMDKVRVERGVSGDSPPLAVQEWEAAPLQGIALARRLAFALVPPNSAPKFWEQLWRLIRSQRLRHARELSQVKEGEEETEETEKEEGEPRNLWDNPAMDDPETALLWAASALHMDSEQPQVEWASRAPPGLTPGELQSSTHSPEAHSDESLPWEEQSPAAVESRILEYFEHRREDEMLSLRPGNAGFRRLLSVRAGDPVSGSRRLLREKDPSVASSRALRDSGSATPSSWRPAPTRAQRWAGVIEGDESLDGDRAPWAIYDHDDSDDGDEEVGADVQDEGARERMPWSGAQTRTKRAGESAVLLVEEEDLGESFREVPGWEKFAKDPPERP